MNWTVDEVLDDLRCQDISDKIIYFYVTDDENRLVGVVPVRRLLMSRVDRKIADIMVKEIVTVPYDATVLQACELFLSHRFLALPVVDADNKLIGVVDLNLFTDEVVTSARQNQADQAYQMIGVHVSSQSARASSWESFSDRFPWLMANITGGLLCAFIASFYESLIEAVTVLALFIPIVLALSESVSMQSMTIVLQSGRLKQEMGVDAVRRMFAREFVVATLLGIGCGSIVGLAALLFGSAMTALVIGVCIFLSIITACLLGVLLPVIIHWLRVDPQIAAGPIVLATGDIITLLFYFNLAGILLS